ncbi:hypothetical protein ACLESO_13585, partial [Pyxidicoccus sp. 3LG]
MPSSVLLMLALATTPGAPSAREPAPAHNFSTAQARTAELLSAAGSGSVKAALRGDAGAGSAAADVSTAGARSVKAALHDVARGRIASTVNQVGGASVQAAVNQEGHVAVASDGVATDAQARALDGAASAATREAVAGLDSREGDAVITASGTAHATTTVTPAVAT